MSSSIPLVSIGLVQLAYVSTAVGRMGELDLRDLTDQSAKHNWKVAITGLLLYKDGNFLQLIEGPEPEIDALWSRIQLDFRHRDVTLLFKTPAAQRSFSLWSMACLDIGAPKIRDQPAYSAYWSTTLTEAEFAGVPEKVRNLLEAFRPSA